MKKIFWVTIGGFLFATFAYFGAGGFATLTRGDAVAKVNKVLIPNRKYQILYFQRIEALREQNIESTEEIEKRLKQEIIQDLISEEAFYQESGRYGISVTDEELLGTIAQMQAFQVEGKFSPQAYNNVLRNRAHMTPKEFEESQRRSIAIGKLRHLLFSTIKVSGNEVFLEYAKRHRGDMKNFEKDKIEFSQTVLSEKRSLLFQDWVRTLGEKVKIEVFLKN